MDVVLLSIYEEFDLGCGCKGLTLNVPHVGKFWVYEATCVEEDGHVSKEDPIVVFTRAETPLDLSGFDPEAKSGYGFSLS